MTRSGSAPTAALHCNLNVSPSLDAAGVYESLGLRVKMRSRAEEQDASQMGLGAATTSEAWFLYDTRGGRGAPAVELVEWIEPKTSGEAYAPPGDVGMQALGSTFRTSVMRYAARPPGRPLRPEGQPYRRRHPRCRWRGAGAIAGAGRASLLRYAGSSVPTLKRQAGCGLLGFDSIDPGTIRWERRRRGYRSRRAAVVARWTAPLELRLTAWPAHLATRPQPRERRGLFRMALAVPDVRAAVEAARESGAIEASDPSFIPLPGTPLGGLWVSFFRDPDGVMVEYVERPLQT